MAPHRQKEEDAASSVHDEAPVLANRQCPSLIHDTARPRLGLAYELSPEHQARRATSLRLSLQDRSVHRNPVELPDAETKQTPESGIFACTKIDDVISMNLPRLPSVFPWEQHLLASRHWVAVLSQSHIASQPPQFGSHGTVRQSRMAFARHMKASETESLKIISLHGFAPIIVLVAHCWTRKVRCQFSRRGCARGVRWTADQHRIREHVSAPTATYILHCSSMSIDNTVAHAVWPT
ncbi:hypothetical protein PVAR5_7700 [Paecilomyces variotii No. 5]|uniref:Uncharacterized protein n=1 Tax=Byssochlamys spectabilis (strain No. 5 / NBRC 109023) TaxID=1356009 RepID=V5I540_BYSSN|nr:hypothetical protein PVAR5_7700 [Paecilomyces variotii No. 5]